jgi:hypothetical protein
MPKLLERNLAMGLLKELESWKKSQREGTRWTIFAFDKRVQ